MSSLKRIFAAMLALVMLMGIFSMISAGAEDLSSYGQVVPEKKTEVVFTGEDYVYGYFIPEESGYYRLYSTGDYDSAVWVYDAMWEELGYSDDPSDDSNFNIIGQYTAGCKYYFEFLVFDYYTDTITFDVFLTKTDEPEYSEDCTWDEFFDDWWDDWEDDWEEEPVEDNVESIEILKDPVKTVYEDLYWPDFTGMKIKVTYKDGTDVIFEANDQTLRYDFIGRMLYVDIFDGENSVSIYRNVTNYSNEFDVWCENTCVPYYNIDFVPHREIKSATAENVNYQGKNMVINLEYKDGTKESLNYDVVCYYDPSEDTSFGVGGFSVDGFAKTTNGLANYYIAPGQVEGYNCEYIIKTLDLEIPYGQVFNLVHGDVDGDGDVSIMDATEIQRCLARLVELDDVQIMLGDADRDGELSVMDATQIQRYLALLVPEL